MNRSAAVSSRSRVNVGSKASNQPTVKPSVLPSRQLAPFTNDQELEPFATWNGDSIWVPPKDSSQKFAEAMLRKHGAFSSKATCWETVEEEFRSSFQHVREIQLDRASIRLPQGRLFVSVTQREAFHTITDRIPACVQTRLEEFLERHGNDRRVKVYYLKPLCIEVNDQLIFTKRPEIDQAIAMIQDEVFQAYRRMYFAHRCYYHYRDALRVLTAIPRGILGYIDQRRQRMIDAYQAKLEFQRRKLALRTAKVHRRCRTHGCTFDEVLDLTNPLVREDVVEQYCREKKIARATRDQILRGGLLSMPWFVALSAGISYLPSLTITFAPPLIVCDPAFVAEFSDRPGVLMKIGHFDEIGGVPHIEL